MLTALTDAQMKEHIAGDLARQRARTTALTSAVDASDLVAQHSPLMSPLVWDLAHIGNQEEIWLLRDVGGREPILDPAVDQLYDAFAHPRRSRPTLPLLDVTESRRYVTDVRDRVFDVLDDVVLEGRPLLENGYAFGMIVQHEAQHDETMLATHQLRRGDAVLGAPPPPPTSGNASLRADVLIPAGDFTMGTSTEPWALDNERPAHVVPVAAFHIDTVPVSNRAYQDFIRDGGYDDPRWWTEAGWGHRQLEALVAPMFWRLAGVEWIRTRFGRDELVPPDEPVMHVCWYEADAYARWAGKRLPTEVEWEKAARFDPVSGRSRRFPWGDGDPTPERANLGQRHLQPATVGGYPSGESAYGVRQLVGDVWEWTSSEFRGYPGFRAWPYREYSEVFFGGEYKTLRGGSFATDVAACRGTFRNWDYPIRRQIFAGFRCARDAQADEGGSDDGGSADGGPR